MLIKISDYRPIQITIETEDEYNTLIGLLSFASHNHPNQSMLASAERLLEDLIKIEDEGCKYA